MFAFPQFSNSKELSILLLFHRFLSSLNRRELCMPCLSCRKPLGSTI